MTMHFPKIAADSQREAAPEPLSRQALLRALLAKRAAAHEQGAGDLEALLRDQIRWALPIHRIEDAD